MNTEPGPLHRQGGLGGAPPEPGPGAAPRSAAGLTGSYETGGVEVRIGSRAERRRDARAGRGSAGRLGILVGGGVLGLAVLVTAGLLLIPGSEDETDGKVTANGGTETATATAGGPRPRGGAPIEVGTAYGARYRIAAVTAGVNDGVAATLTSPPPAGMSFAYIEYVLTNPTKQQVLLDFPGDVFVKRNLVIASARTRCEPQTGVPASMCTPPTRSEVVQTISGGRPVAGDGGDKYMPAGASYLVRATMNVPVRRTVTRRDLGLYVWGQIYMGDRPAKHAPFPAK
ncbi:hypothetical protein [Spirillospora albida]|uniref:hypothetical protein n=1 Tax=Spirillospora albida TaxID=58123 RepID=UPI0004C216ED|nr:hypothetical protein [Spirillospora albida]